VGLKDPGVWKEQEGLMDLRDNKVKWDHLDLLDHLDQREKRGRRGRKEVQACKERKGRMALQDQNRQAY
jgi:hypothetical protein